MYQVALIKDGTGDYFLVAEDVDTFRDLLNKLEDIGAEVIENQTDDWDDDVEAIKEECFSIVELLESSTFVSHDDPRLWGDDYYDIGIQSYSVAERNGSLC
jgi:hypothetical protein